jgi:NAD(P)-dependent dehydrogenase (short-subunit alcohol dehydrogenase family)
MDWENVLIIGASGGIGAALCTGFRGRGANVTEVSRRAGGFDVTDPASVERVLGGLPAGFDALVVATGALEIGGAMPEKALSQITAQAMADQFAVNAIGPALVLRHAARLVVRDRPAHVAVLSARVGSIGDNHLGGWYSYRAAKAAVNQIVHGAAIELGRSHPKLACVALHPGTVATDFTRKYAGRHRTVPAAEAAENLLGVLGGLGPAQTGGFYDWSGAQVPW